ncbi:MAG TPA: polysaccharide deacetylase family protein [Candidatus Angelobacter sp.]|nr:polysaccharide deacetylase family protein [Candidatus Angelobacter sp.]
MGQFRLSLSIAVLCGLTACGGSSRLNAGMSSNNLAAAANQGSGITLVSKKTETATATADTHITAALSNEKLIALTFDDGPRPYVLFGSKGEHHAPALADVLENNGVKATFFVVGWRLTPKTWGEPRHEENIGMTCVDAAEQLIRRGHELEDHTYSHLELRSAEKKNGEPWVLHDVDRGAEAIKAVTGTQPRYVRPPDWIITSDARRDLEHRGYRLLTISSENPVALRDVNSLDYLCAGKAAGCPKPSLAEAVLKQVQQREKKGTFTHILAFHELSTTAAIMPQLIAELKARGYRFVTLSEYMSLVAPKSGETLKRQASAAMGAAADAR